MAELHNAIRAFEPLAIHLRILQFENIVPNRIIMHAQDFRLLAWAETKGAGSDQGGAQLAVPAHPDEKRHRCRETQPAVRVQSAIRT